MNRLSALKEETQDNLLPLFSPCEDGHSKKAAACSREEDSCQKLPMLVL